MDGEDTEGGAARRSSLRKRHVAPKMAVVDDATRKQAAAARLDALENDNAMAPDVIEVREDDVAFNIDDEMDEGQADLMGVEPSVPPPSDRHAARPPLARRGLLVGAHGLGHGQTEQGPPFG